MAENWNQEIERLKKELANAMKALRRARLALAAAAERMPEFDSDYQQLDSFILLCDIADKEK